MEKKVTKKLALSRETVRELTSAELEAAAGAQNTVTTKLSIPQSACPCISMGAHGGCTFGSC